MARNKHFRVFRLRSRSFYKNRRKKKIKFRGSLLSMLDFSANKRFKLFFNFLGFFEKFKERQIQNAYFEFASSFEVENTFEF